MLPITTALLLCAGALATGALAAWALLRMRFGSDFISAEAHRGELATLRRRYRRRQRVLRDALRQLKLTVEELREDLRVATTRHGTQQTLLAAARSEADRLREELTRETAAAARQLAELGTATAQVAMLGRQLTEARDRIAQHERDQGLQRIEHDELVARTQRLRALSAPASAIEPMPCSENGVAAPAREASRTLLAARNARIHELECQLRENESRLGELQSSLDTWKYRIAPLTLHLQRQREKRNGQQAPVAAPPPPATPAVAPDDLQRIRGIGRGLHRKLRDQGIERFQQLAHMGPAELANLATAIGVATSRPQRDRWVEQARALAATAQQASV